MTNQVDVGWASPPFGVKEIEEGKIHIVAKATDAALVRGQTIRVLVANAKVLKNRKDALERFMRAYRKTIDICILTIRKLLKIKIMLNSHVRQRPWPNVCGMNSSQGPWLIHTKFTALTRWSRRP
jgi:hypothetical protein